MLPDAPPTAVDPKEEEREAAEERARAHDLTPTQRLERLENLAMQYFGAHHFEAPKPIFNPDAERDAARIRFQKEMEEIEQRAKAAAH